MVSIRVPNVHSHGHESNFCRCTGVLHSAQYFEQHELMMRCGTAVIAKMRRGFVLLRMCSKVLSGRCIRPSDVDFFQNSQCYVCGGRGAAHSPKACAVIGGTLSNERVVI